LKKPLGLVMNYITQHYELENAHIAEYNIVDDKTAHQKKSFNSYPRDCNNLIVIIPAGFLC
jgi:hypothetical protein